MYVRFSLFIVAYRGTNTIPNYGAYFNFLYNSSRHHNRAKQKPRVGSFVVYRVDYAVTSSVLLTSGVVAVVSAVSSLST